MHVGKFTSIPLFELKLYLPLVSLTDISLEMYGGYAIASIII